LFTRTIVFIKTDNLKKENLFRKTIEDSFKTELPLSYGFQDTNLQKSILILKEALSEDYRIDLGFTSNCITSGCRKIITRLCSLNKIDSIVTTAGGIEEDIIQSLDRQFQNIAEEYDDKDLFQKGYFRSGNRVARSNGYTLLEKHLEEILDDLPEKTISSGDLIKKITTGDGYLPKIDNVFCPCIEDGAIGDYLYIRAKRGLPLLEVSFTKDHYIFQQQLINEKRKKLAILLGGSIPKHYILNSSILSGGYDKVILLNTGLYYDGSNAGAQPSEAYSWSKVAVTGDIVKVFGDFTITFPLLIEKAGIDIRDIF